MSPDEAVRDKDRVHYYEGYLGAVRDAVADGVDIRSYFAWSCYDNFEWASGLVPRFGCVRVDYDTKKRTVKDSARFVGNVSTVPSLEPACRRRGEAPRLALSVLCEKETLTPSGSRRTSPPRPKFLSSLVVSVDRRRGSVAGLLCRLQSESVYAACF